jgi:hypothetical protein
MRLVLAFLLLLLPVSAFAQDADLPQRQDAARRLVEMTTADAVLTPMIDAMWPNIEMQLTAGGGPRPEQAVLDMLKTAFTNELSATMSSVMDDIAGLYADRFTLEELDAIVAFYASPAGTKLIGAQPQIMREMLPSLTQKLQASLPVAMQKVIDDARAQGLDVGN